MYCVVFLTKFLKNITVHVDSIKELGQLDHLNDQIDLRKVYTVFVGPEGADVDFDRPPVVQHIGKELVFSGCFHAYFIAGFRKLLKFVLFINMKLRAARISELLF